MGSTIWYTIITMTSVGYGGIIASTPLGRGVTLLTTIVGAFLLSLLVAIITEWFIMHEKQVDAIHTMTKDRCAVEAVRTAFQYSTARNKRYRLIENGNEENDHIPKLEELQKLKQKMYFAANRFKTHNRKEQSELQQDKRDKTVELLKQQVLDLNDKFDYFVCMMIKSNQIPIENLAKPVTSPKAAKFGGGEKSRLHSGLLD